jgi:hypothetical protein
MTETRELDNCRQLPRLRLGHVVASYLLIVLAIIIGTALGVLAAMWTGAR